MRDLLNKKWQDAAEKAVILPQVFDGGAAKPQTNNNTSVSKPFCAQAHCVKLRGIGAKLGDSLII